MNKCPFKIGEKIVCIYKSKNFIGTPILYNVYEVYIIAGRLYDNIGIKNEFGSYIIPIPGAAVVWENFITFKEYRKLKLKKLNNKN